MKAVISETKGFNLTINSTEQFTDRVVFIDPAVENYQSLAAGVVIGTEVVVLDAQRDGVEQINQVLAGHWGLASLHIVSHGEPGNMQLGTAWLGLETLDYYASSVQSWADALGDEADILLYGCEVAAGQQGAIFVQQLSQLTGAAIAASNNLTGNAALGGDWDLEVTTGVIKSTPAFSSSVMQAYNAVLNIQPVIGQLLLIKDINPAGSSFPSALT